MAYSFDKVMGQLGKGPQQDKADIFGGQSGGSGQDAQGVLGSSTEGELGASGGGDVADAKSNTTTSPSDVSSSAAFRSNVGKTSGPNLGAIKTGVDAKNSALDAEANSYLTNRAELQPSQLSDTDVDNLHGAIDKGYTSKSSGVDGPLPDPNAQPKDSLDYWAKVASGQVEKVDPFKSTVNLKDPTIDNLGTDAGVQNLLRQGQSAEYNIGDAAFDQALLGQDQGFQQGRQDIMDRYRGVQDKQNTMADEVTNKAQRQTDSARSAYLSDLKSKLGGFQSQFTDEATAQEKAIEDAAARRQSQLLQGAGDPVGAAAKSLAANSADPLAAYYSDAGVRAQDFTHGTFDPNASDYRDYLNDDQALRFNNIFSLLGSKDIYGKGKRAAGYGDSDLVSYDNAGLNAALQGGAKTRSDEAAAKAAADAAAAKQAEADQAAAAQAASEQATNAAAIAAGGKAAGGMTMGSGAPEKAVNKKLTKAGAAPLLPDSQDPNSGLIPFQKGGMLEKLNSAKIRKALRI